MATVNLDSIQLWTSFSNPFLDKHQKASSHKARSVCKTASSQGQPELPYDETDQTPKHKDPFKSSITTPWHQDSFAAGVQGIPGHDNTLTNNDGKVDDEFPSIEELWSQSSRQGISIECQNSKDTLQHSEESALNTIGSYLSPEQSRLDDIVSDRQGTRDKPVILEDDELDTPKPNLEAAAVSASELSKGPWYDVEDECYVDDDLLSIPLLKQGVTRAQDQSHFHYHSPRSSQDQINQYCDDGTMRGTLDEPASHSLPQLLEENEGGSDKNTSELERDVQMAFEEQQKSSSTTPPSSPRPYHHSAEPLHSQIGEEHNQRRTSYNKLEEFRQGSLLHNEDQEEPQEQQHKVVVEVVREGDDDNDDNEERESQREKQQPQDENEEISSHPEGSDCNQNTSDESDEDPPPAKRRKPRSARAVAPPLNLRRSLRRSPPLRSSSTTRPEIGEAQPQDDHGCLSTFVDDKQHRASRTSQSPPASAKSAPAAEYREWPFQGFLKRTRIGNETTYNLEFRLSHVPEHLHLPVLSEALGIRSDKETSAEAATPHDPGTHSRVYSTALQSKRKRAPWRPEEDEMILKMREEDGCSWEEIHHALPDRTSGAIQVRYSTKLK